MLRSNLLLILFSCLATFGCGQPDVQFNSVTGVSIALTTCSKSLSSSASLNTDPNCNVTPVAPATHSPPVAAPSVAAPSVAAPSVTAPPAWTPPPAATPTATPTPPPSTLKTCWYTFQDWLSGGAYCQTIADCGTITLWDVNACGLWSENPQCDGYRILNPISCRQN